ncbi:hypothetical protein WR25_20257 [Diploscapter pachys]|uniref:FH2 domain-containing protein n=1 Tax=Diploscapter pachys TaxID=2018661 RepID=A0A2A2LPA7_9BILA|nr:hypothetical protein WR25_20257 [Diploscapter pachys]
MLRFLAVLAFDLERMPQQLCEMRRTKLNFEESLAQLRLNQHDNPEINQEIDRWYSLPKESPEKSLESQSDSLESIYDNMHGLDPLIVRLQDLLDEQAGKDVRIKLVRKMVEALRDVKTESDLEKTLKELAENLTESSGDTPSNNNKSNNSSNNNNRPQAPPLPAFLQCPGTIPQAPPLPPSIQSKAMIDPSKGPPQAPPLPDIKTLSNTAIPSPISVKVKAELPQSMKPKRTHDGTVKMRTLMWSKIPPSTLSNENSSVWKQLASEEKPLSIDFDLLDGMFALRPTENHVSRQDLTPIPAFKRKDALVDLLTVKRSQNVTITLKQFKDIDRLIDDLREYKIEGFEYEHLKTLRSILPDEDEIEALRRYSGDVALLAPACAFFLRLIAVPNYKLRIDSLDFRMDFQKIINELLPNSDIVIRACKEILNSSALKRLLLLLVNIGNYLNDSTAHGNAAGFLLNSIWQIIDLRATKGGMTLMHCVAKADTKLLQYLETELKSIKAASEIWLEEMRNNVRDLTKQKSSLSQQLETLKSKEEFNDFEQFLKDDCSQGLDGASNQLKIIDSLQRDLAAYFCEHRNSFKLEECFKIFANFITRLHLAVQENEERERRQKATGSKKSMTCSHESLVKNSEKSDRKSDQITDRFIAALETDSGVIREFSRKRINSKVPAPQISESKNDRERSIEKSNESQKVDEKKNDGLNTPIRIRRLVKRSSEHSDLYENSTDLNEYIENLESKLTTPQSRRLKYSSSTVCKSDPVTPTSADVSPIHISIAQENDACSSTAGSSPKSGDDEGFESEKDKENGRTPSPTVINICTTSDDKIEPEVEKSEGSGLNQKNSGHKTTIPVKNSPLQASNLPQSRLAKPKIPQPQVPPMKSASTSKLQRIPIQRLYNSPQDHQKEDTNKSQLTPKSPGQPSRISTLSRRPSTEKSPNLVKSIPSNPMAQKPPAPPSSTVRAVKSTVTSLKVGVAKLVKQNTTSGLQRANQNIKKEAKEIPVPRRASAPERKISESEIPMVSTSARPSLIAQGSVRASMRASLPKMDALETPKPLRKAGSMNRNVPRTVKPKWV